MAKELAIKIADAKRYFEEGRIKALDGVNLDVGLGEFVCIMGPSGCGKSTLLSILAGLDKPDSGHVNVMGVNLITGKDLDSFRSKTVGLIFQLHNLIPGLSAVENVQIPMFESGLSSRQMRERSSKLLEEVGLEGRINSIPAKLSGGERQRVAVARAFANDPKLILADEPTGSVDSQTSEKIMKLLRDMCVNHGSTIVLVTHDLGVAGYADRIIKMLDGRIVADGDAHEFMRS